jgi:hypothetical protein
MTVQEFLDQFSEEAQAVVNDPLRFVDFLKHKHRGDKSTREERIPIRAYLRRKSVPPEGVIELGGEAHDFDAKVSYLNEGQTVECTLEVVQALAAGAHKVRLAIADNRMNDAMRAEEWRQFETFPQPIIDAIKAKQDRFYSDTRVLLVSVAGEVTQEDDALIERWLGEVRANTVQGTFSEIYLVETARYLIFKIH